MRRKNVMVRRHFLAELLTTHPDPARAVMRGYRPTLFRYHAGDPWAVTFDFAQGSGWVTWRFARTLLADGLNTRVGEGDVTLTPTVDSAHVLLELSPPTGTVTLRFYRVDLEHALERTETLVPEGTEHASVDWDHEWSLIGEVA